jgi:hypothetical protein
MLACILALAMVMLFMHSAHGPDVMLANPCNAKCETVIRITKSAAVSVHVVLQMPVCLHDSLEGKQEGVGCVDCSRDCITAL